MSLHDDLVDMVLMIRGISTAQEAENRLPYILGRLRESARAVKRLRPNRRRDPGADQAVDWLHRTLIDAEVLTDGQRGELAPIVAEVKRLVGAARPERTPMARSRV